MRGGGGLARADLYGILFHVEFLIIYELAFGREILTTKPTCPLLIFRTAACVLGNH